MNEVFGDTKVLAIILAACVTLIGSLVALIGVIWSQNKQRKNLELQLEIQQKSLDKQLNNQMIALDKQLSHSEHLQENKLRHEQEIAKQNCRSEMYTELELYKISVIDLIDSQYQLSRSSLKLNHTLMEVAQKKIDDPKITSYSDIDQYDMRSQREGVELNKENYKKNRGDMIQLYANLLKFHYLDEIGDSNLFNEMNNIVDSIQWYCDKMRDCVISPKNDSVYIQVNKQINSVYSTANNKINQLKIVVDKFKQSLKLDE